MGGIVLFTAASSASDRAPNAFFRCVHVDAVRLHKSERCCIIGAFFVVFFVVTRFVFIAAAAAAAEQRIDLELHSGSRVFAIYAFSRHRDTIAF